MKSHPVEFRVANDMAQTRHSVNISEWINEWFRKENRTKRQTALWANSHVGERDKG